MRLLFLGDIVGRSGREAVVSLLPRLRPHARALTDAFLLEDSHIRAEIATGVEAERQEQARAHYAELRSSGLAPIDEKDLLAGKKSRR